MPLTIICAWCGAIVGTKPGEGIQGLSITHGICPTCLAEVKISMKKESIWDGTERRKPENRRKGERRKIVRHPVDTLLVVNGVVWVDAHDGTRRRAIRRNEDREYLIKLITENAL